MSNQIPTPEYTQPLPADPDQMKLQIIGTPGAVYFSQVNGDWVRITTVTDQGLTHALVDIDQLYAIASKLNDLKKLLHSTMLYDAVQKAIQQQAGSHE